MMVLGLDVGYFATKGFSDRRKVAFPSLVGSPDVSIFSLEQDPSIILESPFPCLVGDAVLSQSLWQRRRQDRAWWRSNDWHALLLAGLSELTADSGTAALVLGLPVSWFPADKDDLRAQVLGEHRFQRAGREPQAVRIVDARVLPQGIGIAMDAVLDDRGQVGNRSLFEARLAVIDVGGNTVNFVESASLRVGEASASRPIGGWRAVTGLRRQLERTVPGLELRDHELAGILAEGTLTVDGQRIEVRHEVDRILDQMTEALVAEMTQLWGAARQFDRILIGGGGAHLVGHRLVDRFPQAHLVDEPQLANARGYWRFARRIAALHTDNLSHRIKHTVSKVPPPSGRGPGGGQTSAGEPTSETEPTTKQIPPPSGRGPGGGRLTADPASTLTNPTPHPEEPTHA